jgi:hypothetical protein
MGKIVSKTKASYALAKKSPRDLSKVFDYSQQGKNWDKYCQIVYLYSFRIINSG